MSAVNTQTETLDVILEQNRRPAVVLDLTGRMDQNLEEFLALLEGI